MKKNKVLIFALAGVLFLLLLGGGAAAYLFLGPHKAKAALVPAAKPLYFAALDKFVITIPAPADGDSGKTYMEVTFSFGTYDKKVAPAFDTITPVVRSAILSDLMAGSAKLRSPDKKVRRSFEIKCLATVNRAMAANLPQFGKTPFSKIYLTQLVTE